MATKKVRRPPLRQLHDLSIHELAQIRALRRKGLTYTAISRKLGATIIAVVRADQQANVGNVG